jgi:hypothetical protein
VMRSKDSFNKYFSRVSCVPSIVLGTEWKQDKSNT